MIKHYLKISFRNLWKYKSFSAINIAGLAIGMAACLLILQYVSFKLSFDQFHRYADNIYRVVNDRYQQGKLIQHGTITYSGVSKAMNDDYEEVVQHARIAPAGEVILTYNDKKVAEDQVIYADSNFLAMFDFPLIAGDKRSVLKEPNAMIISQSLAEKIFDYKGDDYGQFIGKALVFGTDSLPYKVEAICKNVPENSHLQFKILVSYKTLINSWKEADYDFTQSDFWHYVRLKQGTDYKSLNAKLGAFSQKHFQGSKISGSDETFYLQPLSKAHLYSDFEYEIGVTGSSTVVWALLVIALFIITIAWVNYINLATARSVERAREVGIRKVVGCEKKKLIFQFLFESALVNFISIALAVVLVLLLQPSFNSLLKYQLSLSYLFTKGLNGYSIVIGLISIVILGILISGLYPAFVLSSFKPIAVLKGKFSSSQRGIVFRKALVIGQFSVTIGLIIGSLVVMKQIRYMSKTQLGFTMDQVMVVGAPSLTNFDSTFINRVNSFKEELKTIAHVKGAATSWNVPGGDIGRSFNVRQVDSATTNQFTVRHTSVDYDFLNVYGIKLIAGRNFKPTDHDPNGRNVRAMLINRSAAKLLGFKTPEDAVGKSILRGQRKWDVVGVVENYHQKSLRYPMEPMIFMSFYSTNSEISVKLTPGDLPGTIEQIKKKYEAFFPGNLFDYTFLDETFNRQYENEQLFGKAFGIFAGLAIFVACLGLLGLTMFATIQRTKEIGVRKVLGASVSSIVLLLSKNFLKLILLSSLVAFPLAWWAMNTWLEDFAFRVNIGWWVFILAGASALLIALTTISFQAIKAAIANPVKSLRTE
ncbi:MAG TPA: ABC transporter permease [Chitinophagaceae bacterium]|jgi:putative ABC transport system permease protein|nr:ABC transporter permease [Chitinophagaceae bacterium]